MKRDYSAPWFHVVKVDIVDEILASKESEISDYIGGDSGGGGETPTFGDDGF